MQPVRPEDFAEIQFVADPQISPDGSQIAFVVSEALLTEHRYRSRLWLVNSDGTNLRQLTNADGKDTAPRWAPNGNEIAFLSDRSGSNQIWKIHADGGEATPVTDTKTAVTEPIWGPDGTRIAFTAKVGRDGLDTVQEGQTDENDKSDVKHITRLVYKADGEGFLDPDKRRHIFTVEPGTGVIEQVTSGDWDDSTPVWTPCGQFISFVSNRTDDRGDNRITDIWTVNRESGDIRKLTNSDGSYGQPAVAPNGMNVAFIGNPITEKYGPATITQLWSVGLDGEEMHSWSQRFDRDAGNSCSSDSHYGVPSQSPIWMDDDRLLMTFSDHGTVPLCGVEQGGDAARLIGGDREVISFSMANDGAIAFTASDSAHPAEVFLFDPHSGTEKQLTHLNADYIATHSVQPAERFTYTADDGHTLDAWMIAPPALDPERRYPMILEIHGGPHSAYGSVFMHEFQVLASSGYFVLYTNPRGSTSYGQDFLAGSMGDWGGRDYRDVMAGVDVALERYPIDDRRLGVTGGSYGGYMTNWIITQSDRFSGAVTQRSTSNRHSLFGSSDLVWSYTEWEFNGLPFDNINFYLDRSPISYVENITTPLLILHSENDHRCPIEQSEQLFVALKVQRKPVEFFRFPGESHNLSRTGRPDRRLKRLQLIQSWFDSHV